MNDQTRLAQIRKDQMQWEAMRSDAVNWDIAFTLRMIDQLNAELRKVKKEMAR